MWQQCRLGRQAVKRFDEDVLRICRAAFGDRVLNWLRAAFTLGSHLRRVFYPPPPGIPPWSFFGPHIIVLRRCTSLHAGLPRRAPSGFAPVSGLLLRKKGILPNLTGDFATVRVSIPGIRKSGDAAYSKEVARSRTFRAWHDHPGKRPD